MPLDTTKSVKSITYNGTNIPLYAKPEQEKTVTPTASGVVVTPDTDYTLSKVTVNGDSNLTAGNIKSGTKIFGVTGTYNNAKPEQTKTVDLSMASGNQVISPDSGKVLSSVTVNRPSTLIPDNIKKDVNIGGVVGALESGGSGDTSETWVLNETVDCGEFGLEEVYANFISNSQQFIAIISKDLGELLYTQDTQDEDNVSVFSEENSTWINSAYRKLTLLLPPTGELLTWLQANGVKQEKNLAIQPSKSLTITSNGTTTITPDVPYDAMGQVGVTVNVAGVDMCSLTIKSSGPVIGAPRVWYFDGENTAQVAAYKTPVQVVKNSIIFSNEIFQNTTMLTDVGNGGDGRYAYQITGDCVATVGF